MTKLASSNLLEILLLTTPILTIRGKRYKYELSDFTYGEWIIYEKNQPKYYLNIFESEYDELRDVLTKNKNLTLEIILENSKRHLTLSQSFLGIRFESQSFIQTFLLEKLPADFLLKW